MVQDMGWPFLHWRLHGHDPITKPQMFPPVANQNAVATRTKLFGDTPRDIFIDSKLFPPLGLPVLQLKSSVSYARAIQPPPS